MGFRIISNERDTLSDMFGTVTPYLSTEQVYKNLIIRRSFRGPDGDGIIKWL